MLIWLHFLLLFIFLFIYMLLFIHLTNITWEPTMYLELFEQWSKTFCHMEYGIIKKPAQLLVHSYLCLISVQTLNILGPEWSFVETLVIAYGVTTYRTLRMPFSQK